MRLKRLHIHNLASIQEASLDFEDERIARSGVFLITGDTGSGKSTILDAICLALYSTVPRLERTHIQGKVLNGDRRDMAINDPRQMLRDGTGQGCAQLSFYDAESHLYEATWSVRRANNKPDGKLQDATWTLALEGQLLPLKKKEVAARIESIIGLDFAQFCRTTMLAQGQFTRFLDSTDEEKSTILEKLTDTHIYTRIGKKIYELTKRNAEALEEAKRNVPECLPESERLAIIEDKNRIDTVQLPALIAQINTLRAQRDWLKTDVEMTAACTAAQEALAQAQAAIDTERFKANELLIRQWTESIQARQWKQTIDAVQTHIPTYKQRIAQALQSLHRRIEAMEQDREQLRRQLSDTLLAQVQQVQQQVQQAKSHYELFEQQLQSQQQLLQTLGLDDLRAQLTQTLARMAAIRIVLEERLPHWLQARQTYAQTQQTLAQRKTANEQLLQSIYADKPRLEAARQNQKTAEVAYDALKNTVNDTVKTLRAELKQGDLCPVCGQVITRITSDAFWQERVDEKKREYEAAQAALDTLHTEMQQRYAQWKTNDQQYAQDIARFQNDTSVTDAQQRVIEACQQCAIEPAEAMTLIRSGQLSEQLQQRLAQVTEHKTDLDQRIAAGQQQEHRWQTMLEERTALLKVMTDSETNLSQAQKRVTDAQRQIAELDKVLEEQCAKRTQWQHEAAALLSANDRHAGVTEGLFTNLTDIHAALAGNIHLLRAANETLAANEPPLRKFIDEHPQLDLKALQTYDAAAIDALRNRQNDLRSQRIAAQAAYQTAAQNATRHRQSQPSMPPSASVETLSALIEQKENIDKKQLIERSGALAQQLATDDAHILQAGQAREQITALTATCAQWSQLNALFGNADGKNFRIIAQRYVLAELIETANRYMRTLYSRYTLVGTPGTFIVSLRDELGYESGARRASVTLSGGESFLVSLALALALSEMGDELHVDTLFIDEGFGTLSGEPLDNAIKTLRMLQHKMNRRVGIISHVKELQDFNRIPVQIRLTPSSSSASASTLTIVPSQL